jgi:hypothetical protein
MLPLWKTRALGSRRPVLACALAGCVGLAIVPPSPALAETRGDFVCNINFIGIPGGGDPRLIWGCESPAPGAQGMKINWFAFHMGRNAERGQMILGLLVTAKNSGRPVRVHYLIDDTHPNAWDMNCHQNDCRPIIAIDLM